MSQMTTLKMPSSEVVEGRGKGSDGCHLPPTKRLIRGASAKGSVFPRPPAASEPQPPAMATTTTMMMMMSILGLS